MDKIFDPRINMALILAVIIQTVTAFLWIGGAVQRLDNFETRLNQQPLIAERMARLEAEVQAARQSLNRIEDRLDR